MLCNTLIFLVIFFLVLTEGKETSSEVPLWRKESYTLLTGTPSPWIKKRVGWGCKKLTLEMRPYSLVFTGGITITLRAFGSWWFRENILRGLLPPFWYFQNMEEHYLGGNHCKKATHWVIYLDSWITHVAPLRNHIYGPLTTPKRISPWRIFRRMGPEISVFSTPNCPRSSSLILRTPSLTIPESFVINSSGI